VSGGGTLERSHEVNPDGIVPRHQRRGDGHQDQRKDDPAPNPGAKIMTQLCSDA
jgi:hypothetical protein